MRPSRLIQQVFPINRDILRRLGTDPHLVAFDSQHRDLDPFTGRGFNWEGFAGAAGEYEHGNLLLPMVDHDRKTDP